MRRSSVSSRSQETSASAVRFSTPIDQGVALGLFDQQGTEGRRTDVHDRGAIATAPGGAVKRSKSFNKFIKELIR